MDFKQFADFFVPMTCIVSVEKFPDGSYGNIRIVTGNRAYLDSTEYYQKVNAEEIFSTAFIPDSPYERYIPKDLNFENFCYRSAVLGEIMHTYVKLEKYNFWINMTMIPLVSDQENISYCVYTQEFTKEPDSERMADVSPEISSAVLRTCIKLRGTQDFHHTMDAIIQDIRDLCDASHCCVFLTDFNQRKCSVLCEALSKTTTLKSMKVYVNDEFFENIVSTWPDTIAGSNCLIISETREWDELKKRNPAWCASMQNAGAESIVLFPLKAHGETLGYIWAINFDTARTVQIKEMLELTTFFIASEIASYQLFKRMEILSSIDLLTGVYNRNAMNNRIDQLLSGAEQEINKISIVFADLNGLKHVNDSEGHFAGDMLLKNAAVALQKCFAGCEVYRAGGDEFMIIAPDFPEEELRRRVQMLRQNSACPEKISFAVGFCTDDVSEIRSTMCRADEAMYADKQAFYHKHPDKKREA